MVNRIKLNKKAISVLFAATILLAASAAAWPFFGIPRQAEDRPNVLFIIVDTLRSDRLGCYGYDRISTPYIDSIAARGTLFKNAISQAPLTFPSHCSMFTSVYPNSSGVEDNGTQLLGEGAVTLAEMLKKNGYTTAAFVSTIVLEARYNLDQGFDLYDDKIKKDESKRVIKFMDEEQRADAVTDKAIAWLSGNKDKKFFMFVHYYDPHTPYDPPSPYKERYKDNLYDGEVAFNDEHIGRLLETVSKFGLDKNTLVVFASDHGESLGEHNESEHAVFIYDTTIKVPLIFSYPGRLPERKVIDSQVRLVDIMPTILDILGIKKNREIQGTSLLDMIDGKGRPKDLPAYSESLYAKRHFNWSELRSWRMPDWKYIRSSDPELYDIKKDPKETINLAAYKEDVVKKMDRDMEAFLKKTGSRRRVEEIEVDKKTRDKLMSLGYIQGNIGSSGQPVPRKMVEVLGKINTLDRMANNGMVKEAIEGYKEVLKVDPNNMEANRHLGMCYKEIQDYENAVIHFKRVISVNPNEAEAHTQLGGVYRSMGMTQRTFKEYEAAYAIDPNDPVIINNMGWCAQERGEYDKAIEYYRNTLKVAPNTAPPHTNIAICYRLMGDLDKAIEENKVAIGCQPDFARAYSELGACMAGKGKLNEATAYCKKAVELAPDSPEGYNDLAVCYERKGEYESALANYKKAFEMSPWNSDSACNVANIYVHLKDFDKAREYVDKALKVDPDSKRAVMILEAVRRAKEAK